MEGERMGALLPFGEHKGSGLALMCELLGGAVAGLTIPPRQPPGRGRRQQHAGDPPRSRAAPWAGTRWPGRPTLLLAYVRSSPPIDPPEPVMVAGEPELRERAERLARGVPIDEATWAAPVAARPPRRPEWTPAGWSGRRGGAGHLTRGLTRG